ncbi:hypothetical protein [Ancylobacter oerskovii]|uniref:Uncharacterized protein n=1 Tax=Ancylobacter oerskovii TaxID=459519 RepID=A0ABW4YTN8_9HYPH
MEMTRRARKKLLRRNINGGIAPIIGRKQGRDCDKRAIPTRSGEIHRTTGLGTPNAGEYAAGELKYVSGQWVT